MVEHRSKKCPHGYHMVAVRRPDLGDDWWHDAAEDCLVKGSCLGASYRIAGSTKEPVQGLVADSDEVKILKGMVSAREQVIGDLERRLEIVEGERDANAKSWADAEAEAREARARAAFGEEEEVVHETTNCLDLARDLVCGDRAADYGDPRVAFDALAQAWSAYLEAGSFPLDARDCCNMLIVYKTLRDRNARKPDNMVDVAGYAQVAAWIGDPRGS